METEKEKPMTREYKHVSDKDRAKLIKMVTNAKLSISKASSMLGISYSNSMAIMRVYRKNERVHRKTHASDGDKMVFEVS